MSGDVYVDAMRGVSASLAVSAFCGPVPVAADVEHGTDGRDIATSVLHDQSDNKMFGAPHLSNIAVGHRASQRQMITPDGPHVRIR
jgi:hypothetical protein